MKTNFKKQSVSTATTGGGAKTFTSSSKNELERAISTCFLWENANYEDGTSIANRIQSLIPQVNPADVSALAIKARGEYNLRHAPLWLVIGMLKHESHKPFVRDTLSEVIQRPDELGEFISLYWKDGKKPLAAQAKKGLADSVLKFNEYSLSKYKGQKNGVSLRDVVRLVHPTPSTAAQSELLRKVVKNELSVPYTWETEISAKGNRKEVWEELLKNDALGCLALIRNLRNMTEQNVDDSLIRAALSKAKPDKVLPFRFLAAAKYAKKFEGELESLMLSSLENKAKLPGHTVLILDVSGSMGARLSSRSELSRLETAYALGVLVRELSSSVSIYATAGSDARRVHATEIVPARRGFGLIDALSAKTDKLGGGGIFLKQVMDYVKTQENSGADRVIVLTDEQDCDNDQHRSPHLADAWGKKNYIINISNEKNSVAEKKFTHINGWSESIVDYINFSERQ